MGVESMKTLFEELEKNVEKLQVVSMRGNHKTMALKIIKEIKNQLGIEDAKSVK